ncbi:hypothetical protein BYT27DRAFT_7203861 [Phlegmacium glaucopus]|nr:hypothetical protein BYT27DRAFT_7203861 [Phlegmacium glaucopus]
MSRVLTIAILAILASYASAQPPTCLPGYPWSFNSLNQSPCDMALDLGVVCAPTYTLSPLQPGFLYLGPTLEQANSCQCSSVYYSVLSACAVCQNQTFLSWTGYKVNCTQVYDQVFQEPIPPTTRIPHYAYLDVEVTNGFSITAAENAGGAESSPVPQSTATTSTATATPTSPVKHSKSNAGAIAGGVVGGVVFLSLLGGSIALILRRRKQSPPVPSTYDPVKSPDPTISYGDMNYTSVVPAKIYNPNDPSTFPTNDPVTFSTYSSSPEQRPTFTGNSIVSTPTGPSRVQYSGAPEL